MERVDAIIIGFVTVNKQGTKIGKGGGFSDLEYAIRKEFGIINENTSTITTVHLLQIVEYILPMEKYDVPLDYIITRNNVITTNTTYVKL